MLLNQNSDHEFIREFLVVRGVPESVMFDESGQPRNPASISRLVELADLWEKALRYENEVKRRLLMDYNRGPVVDLPRKEFYRKEKAAEEATKALALSFAAEYQTCLELAKCH